MFTGNGPGSKSYSPEERPNNQPEFWVQNDGPILNRAHIWCFNQVEKGSDHFLESSNVLKKNHWDIDIM
jgi:hypothetical protein